MTITRNYWTCLCLFILTGFVSCDLEDEKIPSYLYIDKFSFSVKSDEGSAHQNITDGRIYVNGNYYGSYELPAWIPVLEEGVADILMFPGIRINGMITNSGRYTLLNSYQTQFTLDPGITDTIRPATSYQDDIVFSVIEDFDHNEFFNKDRDGDSDTKINLTSNAESFEGANSGLIELSSAHAYISEEHGLDLYIPKSGDQIMLELSFKSDIPFALGFIGHRVFDGSEENLLNALVLPKREWTKIYFDFREIINGSNSDYFHLAVSANFVQDSTPVIQRILLDNIKVIHR
jgi:hypothetical protein